VAWLAGWWHSVSGTALQGLEITVVGMILVFFTLGLVIGAMVLLTRLPWLRAKLPPSPPAPTALQQAESRASAPAQEDDLARIAAIAVAMVHSQQRVTPRQHAPARRGAWKSYGRAHQLGL
jgi:Na+-transporting methylmalonyl-CoA/oxaloacetate decarboxylase gamma subunit